MAIGLREYTIFLMKWEHKEELIWGRRLLTTFLNILPNMHEEILSSSQKALLPLVAKFSSDTNRIVPRAAGLFQGY